MTLKYIAIISVFIFYTLPINAQQTNFVVKVTDNRTNQPIAGVYVLMNNLSVGFTDENGVFHIDQLTSDTLFLTHIIYEPQQIIVCDLKNDTNYIQLKEKIYQLSEVSVVAHKADVIAKKAYKYFKAHHRTWNYWAECHYRQAIRNNKEYKSYMECQGFVFLPALESNVWRSAPVLVPEQIRRTREHPTLQEYGYINNRKNTLLIAPGYVENFCDYSYWGIIHPLNRWNYRNYHFLLDTIAAENSDEICLIFRQKGNGFSTIGRWINACHGKIWLDKETYHIQKITATFYRNNHFNCIEETYKEIAGDLFPQHINMVFISNLQGKSGKREQFFFESEIEFPEINLVHRPNYRKNNGNAIDYSFQAIISDYPYVSSLWPDTVSDNKWNSIIHELGDPDINKEFLLGTKQKIMDKTCYMYTHWPKLVEKSKEFIEQMKKDLY